MVQVSYPGVYIVEKPSGVRTITGVATSVAAFVGYTRKGALARAIRLTSFADFERECGGLDRASHVSYAVRQFFTNGGTLAYGGRVAVGHSTAAWGLLNNAATDVLEVSAANHPAGGAVFMVTLPSRG